MRPTTQTTQDLKHNVLQTLNLLRTLRDEVRVEIHLAGMEAKDRWKIIEPQLAAAEKLARTATDSSKQLIDDTLETVMIFKEYLRDTARGTEDEPPMPPPRVGD